MIIQVEISEEEIEGLRRIARAFEATEPIGEWTTKAEARKTGCSLYLKFTNVVDVTLTMSFINLLEQSPALLRTTTKKLLDAHEKATPDE